VTIGHIVLAAVALFSLIGDRKYDDSKNIYRTCFRVLFSFRFNNLVLQKEYLVALYSQPNHRDNSGMLDD